MAARNQYGLTPQQEAFAAALAEGNKTQSDAYRIAYPASLKWKAEAVNVNASQLSADTNIRQRVAMIQAEAAERATLSATEIAREIRRLSLSDIAGIIDTTDGKARVKLPHELDATTRAAIKTFKMDEFGRIEYQFWDKNAAMEKAAKILGMYEKDNKQKLNPLAELLQSLPGNVLGVAKIEAGDPDEDGE